ncbi:hypothetical protein [Kistimonas asteriae]|uniref:hypothetical protein n=1 Tax=Kistimonas asteriae TaxID=517724 RepID=UPI001BA5252B|nr:hypothetical protein [Kistimonas asteriae]
MDASDLRQDFFLRILENQRKLLERHLSQPMDAEIQALKQKSLQDFFDDIRLGIASKAMLNIDGDIASFFVAELGETHEYIKGNGDEDGDVWLHLEEVERGEASLTIEDLVTLFEIHNDYLSCFVIKHDHPLKVKHGLGSYAECLALMGLAENRKADDLLRFVSVGTFNSVSKSTDYEVMSFIDAPLSHQLKNQKLAEQIGIKASDYLERIYDWLMYEMGHVSDFFQTLKSSRKERMRNVYRAHQRDILEIKLAKKTLSERAAHGAKAKNKLVGFYRKKAIEIYEPGVYPTYAEAADKIIAELHKLAESRNERLPLTPTNAQKTVLNWLRAQRNSQS